MSWLYFIVGICGVFSGGFLTGFAIGRIDKTMARRAGGSNGTVPVRPGNRL